MKYLSLYISSLIIVFLVNYSVSIETCEYSFSCNDTLNGCVSKTRTDSSNVFNIQLKPCFSHFKFICDVYEVLVTPQNELIQNCSRSEKIEGYPGGQCTDSTYCLFGECNTNQVCDNSNLDGTCSVHEECYLNQACIEGKCQTLPEGEDAPCETSYQCPFNKICYNKKCTLAYNLADGESFLMTATDRPDLVCESGGYYVKKDSDKTSINEEGNQVLVCTRLFNLDTTCREECRYKNEKDEIIVLPDACRCGYNKDRSKHCQLGNGEKEFVEFLNMKKSFISNPEFTQKCHTVERDKDDICLELKRTNRTVAFRKYAQNYNNAKIMALENARLKEADDCVKEVLFGYNTREIIPDKMQCPKVTCNENIDKCYKSFNPFKEEGDDITIELNSKICTGNTECKLNRNKVAISPVFQNQIIEGQCLEKTSIIKTRYPGESCDSQTPCIEGSTCQEGKCSGAGENEPCTLHEHCLSGLYCSKEEKVCKKQKKEGAKCTDGWECLNYLGCYKGDCILFGTLPDGASVSEENAPFSGKKDLSFYFCEYGISDSTRHCAFEYYTGPTKENQKAGEEFVKCQRDDYCYYTTAESSSRLPCNCGYNEDGYGYCKLPNSYHKSDWKNRIQFLAELTNNNCHTLSRFNCYEMDTEENEKKKTKLLAKTVSAHLYVNSPSCVYDMLISGSYLNINYSILGLLFLYYMLI